MSDEYLVRRFQEHYPNEDFKGFLIDDVVFAIGDALHALLYWKMFFPEFREYEGMVFLATTLDTPELFERIKLSVGKDGPGPHIERDFNFMELVMLFNDRRQIATDEEEVEVLMLMLKSWKLKLQNDFPGRRFVVSIIPEDGAQDVSIAFFQE